MLWEWATKGKLTKLGYEQGKKKELEVTSICEILQLSIIEQTSLKGFGDSEECPESHIRRPFPSKIGRVQENSDGKSAGLLPVAGNTGKHQPDRLMVLGD